MPRKIYIAMPVYNASQTIVPLITNLKKALSQNGFDCEIVAVDDASTDETYNLLNKLGVSVISHKINTGPGNSVLDALEYIYKRARSEDVIVRMDSDYEHNPQDVPRAVARITEQGCDAVMGYMYPDLRNGFAFALMNLLLGAYENYRLFGKFIPQFCPGFYVMNGLMLASIFDKLKNAEAYYAKTLGMPFIHIDVFAMYLSGRQGKLCFMKLKPTKDEWVMRKPFSKVINYVEQHRTFMSHLKELLT